jgi:phospholipase C
MSYSIEHIVVVMLENRSYDNVLGGLYNANNNCPYQKAPANQQGLHGLTGSESNPVDPGDTSKGSITIAQSPDTTTPSADPGEPFSDMAQQIFGFASKPTSNPWTQPPSPESAMQGFVANFLLQKNSGDGSDCMTYLTPAQVPVSAFLANKFSVCDQWYASVPTQTFTNRIFSVCAAPGLDPDPDLGQAYSFVDDAQYTMINTSSSKQIPDLASIFSKMDEVLGTDGPPNWKLYFHDYSITAMIVPYVYQAAIASTNASVATYDDSDWQGSEAVHPSLYPGQQPLGKVPSNFLSDLQNNTLPPLSVIEPRYACNVSPGAVKNPATNPANSNHPGTSSCLVGQRVSNPPAIDVKDGEALLEEIYNSLVASPYWEKSLLIVTYDEGGGIYDSVTPGAAVPPGSATLMGGGSQSIPQASSLFDAACDGFNFDYLGCRVPTIVVSPYIAPGSTIGTGEAFDHTSIIKTVWDCFNLGSGSLTQRDAAARSVMPYVGATASNNPGPYAPLTAAL